MPDSITLLAPILIPMISALLALLARRQLPLARGISVVGFVASMAAAAWLLVEVTARGVIVTQLGGWDAPMGITFVADRLAALMVAVSALMGLAVGIYSLADLERERERFGHHPLMHLLLMGVQGAFLTGDLFNLYVWFEVMLISSFVLMTLGGHRAQIEGALKYMTINLLGSMIFLASLGLLYSRTGALNMAQLHVVLSQSGGDPVLLTIAVMLLLAFGIKAAVFPLFMWLPSSYHTPPTAVSAIFAGLLTKVGVYALLRAFTLLFTFDLAWTHGLLLILAALTMATGVFGAVVQGTVRRILSFHIVSQIGYMVMGLALYTAAGIAGAVFYVVHHIVVKTNLFLIGGVITRIKGETALKSMGGLVKSHPLLAALFLIPGLSLAGIPPLSGFWAKFMVIQAALEAQAWWIAAVALGVGLLTLFSMMKIWGEAYWKVARDSDTGLEMASPSVPSVPSADGKDDQGNYTLPTTTRLLTYGPIVVLALVTVWIGLQPAWLAEQAQLAAAQLLDPTPYVQAVLGGGAAMMYLLVHAGLVVTWLALTGTYSLGNTLFAVVVGYLLMATVERRTGSRAYTRRIPAALGLLGFFLWELLKANAIVAWEMIDPRHTMEPGIIAVPLDLDHPVAVVVLANLITLTPGTLALDLSDDRKTLYVHAMYVTDPEQFRAEIKQGFERRVKEVFA